MKQQKEMPIKNYQPTDRNFQSTEEDIKADKKDHGRLQPEEYPVNKESVERNNNNAIDNGSNR